MESVNAGNDFPGWAWIKEAFEADPQAMSLAPGGIWACEVPAKCQRPVILVMFPEASGDEFDTGHDAFGIEDFPLMLVAIADKGVLASRACRAARRAIYTGLKNRIIEGPAISDGFAIVGVTATAGRFRSMEPRTDGTLYTSTANVILKLEEVATDG